VDAVNGGDARGMLAGLDAAQGFNSDASELGQLLLIQSSRYSVADDPARERSAGVVHGRVVAIGVPFRQRRQIRSLGQSCAPFVLLALHDNVGFAADMNGLCAQSQSS